jgi:hypothetical protein
VVASAVEMLSGKRKRDYAAEAAAQALATQAEVLGFAPESDADDVDEAEAEEAAAPPAAYATASEEEEELVAA